MAVDPQALPAHDKLGLPTRLFELASIVAAVALLVANAMRLVDARGLWSWWMPGVILAGLVFADFVSGVVHWTADTWGSETMPILGRRLVRPFRVHHVNPDDFLQRNWIDTNGDVATIVSLMLAGALFIPLAGPVGASAAIFVFAFCLCGLPTNQVHQWAHRERPPKPIRWLQSRGVLLSREQHARHHEAPYIANYCIATGWCNRPLAALHFFPIVERAIARLTGSSPRSDEVDFQSQLNSPASRN